MMYLEYKTYKLLFIVLQKWHITLQEEEQKHWQAITCILQMANISSEQSLKQCTYDI